MSILKKIKNKILGSPSSHKSPVNPPESFDNIAEKTKDLRLDMDRIHTTEKKFPHRWLYKKVKNPDEFSFRHLALGYSNSGEYDKCLFYCEEGLKLTPKSPYLRYMRARTLGDLGNLDLAIKLLGNIIKDHPLFAEAYVERGYFLENAGKMKSALKDYRRAQEIDSTVILPESVMAAELQKKLADDYWIEREKHSKQNRK
ncbi:tetratricopeptide repeat protein [Candidatus Micrarchaeota archaeon]|nr:tetratricopeptide repeat protein [Candidatus Micrarchaeota archaeon]